MSKIKIVMFSVIITLIFPSLLYLGGINYDCNREMISLSLASSSPPQESHHYKGVETFRGYITGVDPGFYTGTLYANNNWESKVVEEHFGHKKVLFIDTSSPTNYWESFDFAIAGNGVIEMYVMIADANAPIVFTIGNIRSTTSPYMNNIFWYKIDNAWEQRSSWDSIPVNIANQDIVSSNEWFIPKFTYSTANGGTWSFSLTYGPNLENSVTLSSVTNVDAQMSDVWQISVSNAWNSGVDTWIDSVSYTWSINPPYSEGDLLDIDTSILPSLPNESILFIGLGVLALVIGIIVVIKLKYPWNRAKKSSGNEISHKKVPLRESVIDQKTKMGVQVDSNIEKLKKIFGTSKKLKIEDVANALKLDQEDFLQILIQNRHSLGNITIEGDYIIVSSGEAMDSFISMLDNQFQTWNESGKKIKSN
jgi:hypothetical protein